MMTKNIVLIASCFLSLNAFSQTLIRGKSSRYMTGEILVKYKSTVNSSNQKLAIEREGGKRLQRLTNKGWARVKYRTDRTMKEAMEDYKSDPNVESVQPNYIYHAMNTPNDPKFTQLWGLKNTGQSITTAGGPDTPDTEDNPGTSGKDMGLTYAWDTITDCSSVVVAVVDSGVNYNHADLATNMWDGGSTYPKHGYNFVDGNNDPMDLNGHGTHVAGTIGAIGNNSAGSTGVCWQVKLMAVRVLDATGSGTTASVISGVDFAVANGAKVINMSLGGSNYDSAYETSIENARQNGVLVVVAAGNDGTNNDSGSTPSYPCNFNKNNILCVAALTQKYSLASFSNYGATNVDVGAPGVNVVSEWPGTHTTTMDAMTSGWNFSGTGWGYKTLSLTDGTSMACLVNPTNFSKTSSYANNMNATAWKSFSGATGDAVTVSFAGLYELASGDYIDVYLKGGTTDPTSGGSNPTYLSGSTDFYFPVETVDATTITNGNLSVGFNFLTNSSGTAAGSAIAEVSITKLSLNTTSYNVISGTSMATPHVAGLAAMLFAYNPSYTYTDVINSIKNGGVAVSALSGKTVSGKAASAIGSLNYIATPVGGAAAKIP